MMVVFYKVDNNCRKWMKKEKTDLLNIDMEKISKMTAYFITPVFQPDYDKTFFQQCETREI